MFTVIDIYHFQTDGTGDFQRCFFNDDSVEPVIVQGILGYGVYTYSSVADGTVSIALKNNWNQSYPQTWNVAYADETITAKGVDAGSDHPRTAEGGYACVRPASGTYV